MVDILIYIATALTGTGLLLALYRFLKGPTPADRVVAFDTLTLTTVSLIVIIALAEGRGIYLDVAVVYALLSFLGVIAVARYLERGF
ncbi:MAG TPA: monovalent cation/H+ antiporter complex subunit F [bacterium]|nr:monovalent cation/H+ antiporter complex subunit F [bacterium]